MFENQSARLLLTSPSSPPRRLIYSPPHPSSHPLSFLHLPSSSEPLPPQPQPLQLQRSCRSFIPPTVILFSLIHRERKAFVVVLVVVAPTWPSAVITPLSQIFASSTYKPQHIHTSKSPFCILPKYERYTNFTLLIFIYIIPTSPSPLYSCDCPHVGHCLESLSALGTRTACCPTTTL